MRGIKFIAWSVNSQRLVDLKALTQLAVEDMDGLFIPCRGDIMIMEFTGLLDKNGKEIYEGFIIEVGIVDLCRGNRVPLICSVYMDVYIWKLRVLNQNPTYNTGASIYLTEGFAQSSEIIGNIYANPELIKEP